MRSRSVATRLAAVSVFVLAGCGSDASPVTGAGGNGGIGGVGAEGGTGGNGGMAGLAFEVGDAVLVSEASPFAECTADLDPDGTFFASSEVEPWLAVNPLDPDHMAAAWQQDRYIDGGCRGNVVSVSLDGGATWESSLLPDLTPCTGADWERASDPWVSFAANGDLYSVSLVFTPGNDSDPDVGGILVHKSQDGGLSWGDPITISESGDDDKQTLTTDPFDACSAYVVWTRPPSGDGDVLFSRTVDCGETWSEPGVIHSNSPPGLGAQIVVLPDRSLVAVFAENGLTLQQNEVLVKRSMDGGETWPGEPVVAGIQSYAFPVAPDSDERVRSGVLDVAVDRDTGALYAVWEQFEDGTPPVSIAFTTSVDGGLTWSPQVIVDQTPAADSFEREQAFIPSVEVSDDGTIGVTYFSFENDTPGDARSDTDVWFIHCHPDAGGCSDPSQWSDAQRLTASSFDYQAAPQSNLGYFVGDYMGLASAGSDFFGLLSVTTDDDPADVIWVPIRAAAP